MSDNSGGLDIAQLVAEHHSAVYRYAYRLAGNAADAEDLTQQVFLVAQQRLAQVRTAESARSWLFTILRNYFLKSRKKNQLAPIGNLSLCIETIPDRIPEHLAIDHDRLQRAVQGLPPHYRVVVAMFYYEDCSYREIAEHLKMPIGTVMSRLARAKAYLRSRLFDHRLGPKAEPAPTTARQ